MKPENFLISIAFLFLAGIAFAQMADDGLIVALSFTLLLLFFPMLLIVFWAGYRAGKASGSVLGGAIGGAFILVVSTLVSGILNLILVVPLTADAITAVGSVIGLIVGLFLSLFIGLILGAIGGFFGKKKTGVKPQVQGQPAQHLPQQEPIIEQTKQPVPQQVPPRRHMFQKPFASTSKPQATPYEQPKKIVPNLERPAQKPFQPSKPVQQPIGPVQKSSLQPLTPVKKELLKSLPKKEVVPVELSPLQPPEKEIEVKQPSELPDSKKEFQKPFLKPVVQEPIKPIQQEQEPIEKINSEPPQVEQSTPPIQVHTPLSTEEKSRVKTPQAPIEPSNAPEVLKPEQEIQNTAPTETPIAPQPPELSTEEQEQVKQLVEILGDEKQNYSIDQVQKVILEKGYSNAVAMKVIKKLYE